MADHPDNFVPIINLFREVVFFVLIVGVVYGDLRHGRAFNWLTLPAMGIGLALAFGLHGLGLEGEGLGLVNHVMAVLLPIGIFGIPYSLGWFGAGDVKFVAAVGALEGPSFVFMTMALTGVAGLLLAAATVLARRLRPVAAVGPAESGGSGPQAAGWTRQIPYGTAIAAGAVLTWFGSVLPQ
ncbi:MAG: prepilin peptidase [Planctomycetes bacterium]|nr:prepilin peptidase [Planctomycetota bacterium]